ncbi:MAG: hypothetical protein HY822_23005 [Acidobacteria bacterium]|nr:hypothetical protein [Acidobacteriota bacterium]
MPRIVHEEAYDGVREKAERLGLLGLIDQVRSILTGFTLLVEERKDANGAAALRKMIDSGFEATAGWSKQVTGSADWTKRKTVNGTTLCIQVEVQVSARSDSLIRDVIHLRDSLERGELDIGIVVVSSNRLGLFLTDRVPKLSDALRTVKEARAEDLPFLVIAIEHDGAGPPLPKQRKRKG